MKAPPLVRRSARSWMRCESAFGMVGMKRVSDGSNLSICRPSKIITTLAAMVRMPFISAENGRQASAGLVVFRRYRNKQASGDGDAGGNRRDKSDHKHERVAHLIRDRKPLRKKIELIEDQENTGEDHKGCANFHVFAQRVILFWRF